jgi:lipopolysaccharide heptosyltransferase II
LPALPEAAEILIVRLRSVGDVVLLTPALAALHSWRPDLRLAVLIERSCKPVLEGNPAVAEILVARDFLSTVRDLRRRRFAVAYNLHGGPRSAILTAASGAAVRVCWEGAQFSFFYNVLVPRPATDEGQARSHTVEHRMMQFYWTGLSPGPIPPAALYPHRGAVTLMEQVLAERGIAPGGPYAVLRPGAATFTKRWAPEHFAMIARWLRETHGLVPVVDLGPGERGIGEDIRRSLGPESVILDSLSLRELIALIAGARLFVGNDTGPTHIAAALGRPCVAIFGSSSPANWRPWSTEHRVVANDFPCNPCPGDRCYAFAEPRCILSVTVDQVRDACEALLTEQGRAGRVGTDSDAMKAEIKK